MASGCMILGEYLRNIVLNSSILICDTSTSLSFLFEQLLTNIRFVLFSFTATAISIFISLVVFIKKRDSSPKYLFYVFAALVFYSAAILKSSFSNFGYAFGNFDKNVYSSLIQLISDKKSHEVSFKQSMMMLFTGLLGRKETSECELKKINLQPYLNGKNIAKETLNADWNIGYTSRSFLTNTFESNPNAIPEKLDEANLSAFNSAQDFDKEKIILIEKQKATLKDKPKEETIKKVSDKNVHDFISNDVAHSRSMEKAKVDDADKLKMHHSTVAINEIPQSNNNNIAESEITTKNKTKKGIVVVLESATQSKDKSRKDSTSNTEGIKKEDLKSLIKDQSSDEKQKINELTSTKLNVKSKKGLYLGKLNNSDEEEESDESRSKDSYFRRILHKLNQESFTNQKLTAKFIEIERILAFIEEESQKLDLNLKNLSDVGSNIEKELKSFNSSLVYLDAFRFEIGANIKKILKLKKIRDNMYINENDAKEKSKPNTEDKARDKTYKPGYHSSATLQVIFFIEILFFLMFLYFSVVNSSYYIIKLITSFILIFNVLYGFIIMTNSHFYDKDCMLGKVPDCRPRFSYGFEKFARSTSLDLKGNQQDMHTSYKIDMLRNSLENLENMSSRNSELLKEYLFEDYIGVFRLHKKSLDHLLSKLNFVKDDFEDLVHKKVDKKQFFSIVDAIDITASQLEIHLEQIEKRMLLEYYTQETIFHNFLSEERNNILAAVQNEIENSSSQAKIKPNKNCYKKIEALCLQKTSLDFIYLIQIFGAVFLGAFLIF